jgi:succinoglycan biosynthesis protein ExoV
LEEAGTADWLIGIGSILDGRLNHLEGTKLVMGTGYRPTRLGMPDLTSCRIGFVRGPLSARALGLPDATAIADPAVLFGFDYSRSDAIEDRPAFMPHVGTHERFDCSRLAETAGVTLIDPSAPVDDVLRAISRAPRIVVEAMHGAILADAMGVPWTRLSLFNRTLEGRAAVDFKWQDWGASLNLDVEPAAEAPLPWPGRTAVRRLVKRAFVERSLRRAARGLRSVASGNGFRLSNRGLLRSRAAQLREAILQAQGASDPHTASLTRT